MPHQTIKTFPFALEIFLETPIKLNKTVLITKSRPEKKIFFFKPLKRLNIQKKLFPNSRDLNQSERKERKILHEDYLFICDKSHGMTNLTNWKRN